MAISNGIETRLIDKVNNKDKERSRWVFLYTTVVTGIGIAIIYLAFRNPPADILGLALFALLSILAELFSVELFVTSRGSRVSVSSVVALASIVAFGPLAGGRPPPPAGLGCPS